MPSDGTCLVSRLLSCPRDRRSWAWAIHTHLSPLLLSLQEVGSIIGKVGVRFCSVYSPQREPQPWLRGDHLGILVLSPTEGRDCKANPGAGKSGVRGGARALVWRGREVAVLCPESLHLG